MNLQLRENYKHALVVPTSMGLRLTPENSQPVHSSRDFKLYVTSAESNVASISSYLGLPVKVLTSFVQDSPMAALIRSDLLSRGMTFEGPEVDPGGPWGYRHQINIVDTGFGARGPRVYNDRAGEVGRTLNVDDFDLERLFVREGVRILHMSGLIAALSPETGRFCLELARAAKKHGTLISFDLNYRASFWDGREVELAAIFVEIAGLSDILAGNEEDFQLCLGIKGPEAGGQEISNKISIFQDMIGRVRQVYPQVAVFCTTLRQVISAGRHLWGAVMLAGDTWHIAEPREIEVLDRIGGGDGFIGGVLYGILREWDSEKWLRFGWACGAMATTFLTDYAIPADEDQVWGIWHGNARVKR